MSDSDSDSNDFFDDGEIMDLFDVKKSKRKIKLLTNDVSLSTSNYKNQIPWTEKYRPKKIDDILEQDEIMKVLKNTLATGQMPHLLFFGSPGTGKTTTILALAHQLFGPKIINDRVKELNASDDRGIGIVRNSIITFAKRAIGAKDPKYPCPNFKIIILDEADAMTPEAQAALRKVIENKSAITRFCFICNYIEKIIDPIASRCMRFRFKSLEKDAIINKMKKISVIEDINLDLDCIKTIESRSQGDARRCINTLQNMKYLINYKKKITPDDIINITGGIIDNELKDFWQITTTGTIMEVRQLAINVQKTGHPLIEYLTHLHKCVLKSKLTDIQKSKISIEIGNTDRRLTEGSDEYLQMLNILLYINNIVNSK